MNIPRPFDTIEKVEDVFSAVRREALTRTDFQRLTATAFKDKLLADVQDITPGEQGALLRWYNARMRG